MADRLKALGYKTGLVGKWHQGYEDRFLPRRRGFDEFLGFLGGAHPYTPAKGEHKGIFRGTQEVPEKEYLTGSGGRRRRPTWRCCPT